ncbi:FMN-binding negative transcriptional regulator [Streptomyces sp. NPDC093109]|uniref:FMN-binding negative transcriptional regulator n=1 Tax=Streptomyces sp. NPDC093109 TaxID=3154977 RepID=UPI00344C7FA2
MRDNPDYALTDEDEIKRVITAAPWATMISHTEDGLVASHYPFLLDPAADGIVLLSHVGRPDELLHGLGERELLVVFYGPSGYVSPSWYGISPAVPTWNYTTVHAYGVPEILSAEDNLRVLEDLVDHFEEPLPHPFRMRLSAENEEYAERIAHGTAGFRLRVTRVVAKNKMSQDKPRAVVDRVVEQLSRPGPYANAELASRMLASRPRET